MATVRVRAWEELVADYNIEMKNGSTKNDTVLTHKYRKGGFSKSMHHPHCNKEYTVYPDSDGWVKINDIWFPDWSFVFIGETVTDKDFKDDYDMFLAWDRSIERRREIAEQRVKEAMRKAYPKEYRHEQEEKDPYR